MKRKRGFTLIELLAVIVILAIIALIATPMILGVIDSSKRGSAESSAYGYLEAVEQYYVTHMMTSSEEIPSTIEELNGLVTMKGEKPTKGSLVFGSEGYIEGAVLCINNYYVDYRGKTAKVDTSKSCDDIKSEPNKPMLLDNMIPVVYENGNWVKASNDNWYDYDTQKWANAVTVKENNRATYLSSEAGTVIPMDEINLMFVWIPRYEYHIEGTYGLGGTTKANPGEIEVNWIGGKSKKSTQDYIVHPGFTFGNTELTGFWVGKFEPSATEILNTQEGDDIDTKTILIKPNLPSWRNNRIATAFTATRRMELASNPYGFVQTGTEYNENGTITNDSNSIDTHMMKNSEWGAVSYLTQSKYGKYGNPTYSGANKEVYINNHSGYLTGCSSGAPSTASSTTCANTYDVEGAGTGASTTGTIYGIYDMNGGAWERVMGNYNKMSGYSAISYTAEQATSILGRTDGQAVGIWNSGFNGPVYGKALDGVTNISYTEGISFPDEKYYDLYTNTNKDLACNGGKCQGDGTTETVGWYSDYATFLAVTHPWVLRGGAQNEKIGAGMFSSTNAYGSGNNSRSFRVVLSAN